MRRFYLVPVMGALMLGLPCLPAFAVGNVLVPTDDASPSSTANKSPGTASSSHQAPAETILPADGSSDKPPINPSNPETLGYTPMPPSSMAAAGILEQKPPTQIVKMPAPGPIDDSLNNDLPGSLNVSMQKYSWGPDDISLINSSLSIPPDQVSKHCRLSAFGTLISDTGGYIFNVDGAQSQAVLHYGGTPSGINVMAQAMCDTLPLPPNSGTILQIGDKYVVYITQIQCPPPLADSRGLAFQYAGNGKAQCVYH